VWLIFSTFMLAIFGTLLTRSGLVSSVHAFAQSSIGSWFWAFLIIVMSVCLFTYILQRDHLKADNKLESLVSRESSFLFNNLVLLAACFTVLWGTLFPVLSEYVQGNRVTVGAPFYNRVAVPIGLFLLFLTGIGPLLAWRSSSFKSIRKNFVLPTLAGLVAAVVVIACGVHPWEIFTTDSQGSFYAFFAFVFAAMVVTAISAEFLRGAGVISRHTGQGIFASMVQLTRRNTRRYGGYIVHFGVVVIFIGIAGSAFNQSKEQELGFKQSLNLGPYRIECQSYSQDSNANYDTEFALLDVYRGGRKITQLAPEKRFYIASQQPSTMVANHSTLAWDLYVIYAGKNPDTGQPIIKVFLNPLVAWIWIGVAIIVFGTGVALVPNMTAALAASRNRVPAAAVADAVPARGGD
jgi:cytochrome c-type biogenesis protein CcmF